MSPSFVRCQILLSDIPITSVGGTTNYAHAKYANTQTQANTNDCNTGTDCAITSPQTQGDGSASALARDPLRFYRLL